jgi:hypothetical protein
MAEVTRSIEVAREFDTHSIGTFSSYAFEDVPLSQLSGGWSANSGEVTGPDGGTACVCTGSFVGKERLRARKGMGQAICMTSSDLDASAFVCQPIKGWREVGDFPPFPFRRVQPFILRDE